MEDSISMQNLKLPLAGQRMKTRRVMSRFDSQIIIYKL